MVAHISAKALKTPPEWSQLLDRIEAYHRLDRAEIRDIFLGPPDKILLSRAAWIKGLGFGVKSVTAFSRERRPQPAHRSGGHGAL